MSKTQLNLTVIIVAVVLVIGIIAGIYLFTSSGSHSQTSTQTTVGASTTAPTTSTSPTTVLKASQFIIAKCNPAPGFGACYNPTSLSANGNLTFTLFQTTGSTLYNVGMACAAARTSVGLPNPPTAMIYLSASGAATTAPANGPSTGALNLLNGQSNEVTATGLKCFGSNGTPLSISSFTPGMNFSLSIWINYTVSAGRPSTSNPMYTTIIGVGSGGSIINVTTS